MIEEEDFYKNLENFEFDLDKTKLEIPNFTSEKLCEIIVCYRYLNLYKELNVLAMEELSKRRLNGDSFDFENYIDNSYKELPAIDLSIPDISSILSTSIGFKI